jgi:hypothetical protein
VIITNQTIIESFVFQSATVEISSDKISEKGFPTFKERKGGAVDLHSSKDCIRKFCNDTSPFFLATFSAPSSNESSEKLVFAL